jgi:hypothetical protein
MPGQGRRHRLEAAVAVIIGWSRLRMSMVGWSRPRRLGRKLCPQAIRDTPSTAVYPSAAAELGACRCRQPRASKRHSRLFGGSGKRCNVQPPPGRLFEPAVHEDGEDHRCSDANLLPQSVVAAGAASQSSPTYAQPIGAVANRAVHFTRTGRWTANPIPVGARRTLHCVRLFARKQHQQKLFAARRSSRCPPLFDEAPATRSYGHHT